MNENERDNAIIETNISITRGYRGYRGYNEKLWERKRRS